MFLYLSKILPALLAPFSIVLLLLLAALITRKWRVRAISAVFLVLLISSCPFVSDFLLRSLEAQYPDRPIDTYPPADAIVVLGGSVRGSGGLHRASRLLDPSDRLLVAFRLYRAGKAPWILCSGGNLSLFGEKEHQPEAEVISSLLQEWGVPAGSIRTESGSVNTHENAVRSHDLLARFGVTRILLVTSAMHMPRAAATFRKAGFDVIPAPADFKTGWDRNFLDWLPNAASMIDSERTLREWVGLWTYRFRGWAS
jgi:uncharacterized SAM-binding protein YcdF (DUF218 family)